MADVWFTLAYFNETLVYASSIKLPQARGHAELPVITYSSQQHSPGKHSVSWEMTFSIVSRPTVKMSIQVMFGVCTSSARNEE